MKSVASPVRLSAAIAADGAAGLATRALAGPLPLLAGWCLLYAPIYRDMAQGPWQMEQHAHGPLVMLIATALLWNARAGFAVSPASTFHAAGLLWLGIGLMLAVVGHAQEIALIAMASQILVLAGLLHARCGAAAVRAAWFPLFFLAFAVPLPGMVLDTLTLPLKEWISLLTANLLHALGYPAARSGVVLVVGQYQLLIADACSGLHSLITLFALGSLYAYLAADASPRRRLALLAASLPIALGANLLRVVVLALTTYHAGDAAGRQWHEIAGFAMFAVALGGLITLDRLLTPLDGGKRR